MVDHDSRAGEAQSVAALFGTLAPRVAAVVSAVCLILHLALLPTGGAPMITMTLPMLVLSLLCTVCAARLWRAPTQVGEQVMMIGSGLAMVLFHLLVAHGHQPSSPTAGHPGSLGADLLMNAGLTLAAAQGALLTCGLLARVYVHHTGSHDATQPASSHQTRRSRTGLRD